MTRSLDLLYSGTTNSSGLQVDCDFLLVIKTMETQLLAWHHEWLNLRHAVGKWPDEDSLSIFGTRLTPAFGFCCRSCADRGIRTGGQVSDAHRQLLLPLRDAYDQRIRAPKRPRALRGRHRPLLCPLPLVCRELRVDLDDRHGPVGLAQVRTRLALRPGFLCRVEFAQGGFLAIIRCWRGNPYKSLYSLSDPSSKRS